MSQNPGITLTREAQSLITNLINIDTNSKAQKDLLFECLWEMWRDDLLTGNTNENKFEINRVFIKSKILESYADEGDRLAEKIQFHLESGKPYQTLKGEVIIPCASEILKYKKHARYINNRVNLQFNRLAKEFDEFIGCRGILLRKPIEIAPMVKPVPRKTYIRSSKDPKITYHGLAEKEPPEIQRKTKGIRGQLKLKYDRHLNRKVNFTI